MKLFFRHFGQGEPMIILHGLFGISDNWVSVGKNLAEHARVYIPDLRNHGQSSHSPVFTINALVEDLYEFIEDLGLGRVTLVGHSLGGIISMQFSLQYPDIVKKLVVVDISLRKHYDYSDHLRLLHAMMEVDFKGVTKRSDVERQLMATVSSQKLRKFLLKSLYWRDKHNLDWRLNLSVLIDNLPLDPESFGDDARFEGPSLFIKGGWSGYIRDEDIAEIHEKFPRAVISTIPNASHWVHADAPEEFLSSVLRFLFKQPD